MTLSKKEYNILQVTDSQVFTSRVNKEQYYKLKKMAKRKHITIKLIIQGAMERWIKSSQQE